MSEPGSNGAVEPALVYGVVPFHGRFALLRAAHAAALADELDAVRSCATMGTLRVTASDLKVSTAPVDADDLAAAADDEPFRWEDSPGFLAGTWPPLPTADVFTWASPELLGRLLDDCDAERWGTERHGDGYVIPLDRETELVALVTELGHQVHDDNDLVRRLCWPED